MKCKREVTLFQTIRVDFDWRPINLGTGVLAGSSSAGQARFTSSSFISAIARLSPAQISHPWSFFAFFKLRILFLHRPLRCPNDNCKYVAISRFGSKGQWLLFLLLVCLSFSTFSQLFHFIFSFCPFPPTGHAPGDLQNVLQLPCPLILIPLFKTLFASSAMKIDHSWQKFLLPRLQFLFPLPLATPPAPVV